MIARLLTALFYAAVFFYLGAWSGGHLKPIGDAMWRGAIVAEQGAENVWTWAFGTQTETDDGHSMKKAGDSSNGAKPATVAEGGETDRIERARAAFAAGDLKTAIGAYRAYIADHPADADALGELGNVYFNGGRSHDAAVAFHAAGLLMVANGETDSARALLPAIRAGAPALADDLSRRLGGPSPEPVTVATDH